MPIDHGTSDQERRDYPDRLRQKDCIKEYYCKNGKWEYHSVKPGISKVRLVEVWEPGPSTGIGAGAKVWIHPSGNPFYLVKNGDEKIWMKLAQLDAPFDPLVSVIRGKKCSHELVNVPVFGPIKQSFWHSRQPHRNHTEFRDTPAWGEEKVIGYTCEKVISWPPDSKYWLNQLRGLKRLPSIYYLTGHLTMDHESKDQNGVKNNVGWKNFVSTKSKCLFFGNVDVQAL